MLWENNIFKMIVIKSCRNEIGRKNFQELVNWRTFSTKHPGTAKVEKELTFVDNSYEQVSMPQKSFDKSGLLQQHRNMLHDNVPYSEPHSWIHCSEKYQRKLFGRYGNDSGVDSRICFNTKEDTFVQADYEKVAHPYSLSEMISNAKNEKAARQAIISQRERDISKKLEKLDQWKKELNVKIAKKESDTIAAKERKERLIEEVRRHFGFKVDPRDERFKEMLEQKEREDKKKQKEAKRKAKEDKMMAKLVEKST